MAGQEKHAPGPWRAEHWTPGGHDVWVLYAGDRAIGHYAHYGRRHIPGIRPNLEAEAHARLIAAAPELLDALLAIDRAFAADDGAYDDPQREAIRLMDAAIATATGQEASHA